MSTGFSLRRLGEEPQGSVRRLRELRSDEDDFPVGERVRRLTHRGLDILALRRGIAVLKPKPTCGLAASSKPKAHESSQNRA